MSLLNKLRPFGEWHDMDDRLTRAVQESTKKREAFIASQGRAFHSFLERQPEEVHGPLTRAHRLLVQTQETVKGADEVAPKMRNGLNQIRPLNDDIKLKRRLTQGIRERAAKSARRAEAAEQRLEALHARSPGSPDYPRVKDERDRAASQADADAEAAQQRDAQLAAEEVQYKKGLFLAVLGALEEFTAARGGAAAALAPMGEQIEQAGAEVPFFQDPGAEQLSAQLKALEGEPLDD
jgi:hypothetical protein